MSKCIRSWFLKDRNTTPWDIFSKIVFAVGSIFAAMIFYSLFYQYLADEEQQIKELIFYTVVIGWFVEIVRSWLAQFLSKEQPKSIWDMFPTYIINYPFLIFSICIIVTHILPLFFNKPITDTQKYGTALILGFATDGIWELFKTFPKRFRKEDNGNTKKS